MMLILARMALGLGALATACLSPLVAAWSVGGVEFSAEVKAHLRHSEDAQFAVDFPFPPEALPVGEATASLRSVNPGNHAELSQISLFANWRPTQNWQVLAVLEAIDKYERNPTSTDHKIGLDTFIVRYGQSLPALETTEILRGYVQLGKFSKLETQRERRTESYGLAANAFNRFEDSGLEAGVFLPGGLYARGSWTTGNPLFFRDPNALAGDNGTEAFRVPPNLNPDPRYKSGLPILYDAEIESLDLGSHSELGGAVGYRYVSADRRQLLDVMAHTYHRTLARSRSLHGTFYGADLDLLDLGEVPGAGGIALPVTNDKKRESGVSLWYEAGDLAAFAQVVDQRFAGLGRRGYELELSYAVPLRRPIVPVIRFSRLQHDFEGNPAYPAPSVWWDWRKVDLGVNVLVTDDVHLIFEYSYNSFEVDDAPRGHNNEALMTLRWSLQ